MGTLRAGSVLDLGSKAGSGPQGNWRGYWAPASGLRIRSKISGHRGLQCLANYQNKDSGTGIT